VEVADAVFVQPHFDDVALSCGATLAMLAETMSPLMVTVFAGEPTGDVNEFARFQHERWALPDFDVVPARRREDANAAIALGSSVRVRWLNYPDAIYRRPEYGSEKGLFSDIVAEDVPLIAEVTGRLAELGEPIFLPLSVARHVDHRIVFDAGLELQARGADVWFYADLPYALDETRFASRLGQVEPAEVIDVELTPEALDRRWAAIECYSSQLPVLFRGMDDPRALFEGFGRSDENGKIVDRFWRLKPEDRTLR
jgi:LmbE family N-acetylglucosaminyl deacetylase